MAIDANWLRNAYSEASGHPGAAALEAMINYAATKGWTTGDVLSVFAHLVALND